MSNLFPFNRQKHDNLSERIDHLVRGSVESARNFFMDNFRLDIQETEDQYVVEAELPGIEKDDISITMDEGILAIAVEKQEEEEKTTDHYVHRERRYRTMRREVYLKDAIEEETTARMEGGILYVTVKKEPTEDTSRTIDIE